MINHKPTRTEGTKNAYRNRVRQMIGRFEREMKISFRGHYSEFYDWFEKMKPGLANSTWRQYRSALIYVSESIGLRTLEKLLHSSDNRGCKGEPRRFPACERMTSAKKKKSVTEEEYWNIVKRGVIAAKKSYWLTQGLRMFVSIVNVGLRPCEFHHANIFEAPKDDGGYGCFLRVKNAKNTNGRCHGDYRTIPLEHLSSDELSVLKAQLYFSNRPRNCKGRDITHEKYVSYASKAFSKFTKSLYKRRLSSITLYTGRHQFCANLKRNGASDRECAALMSHAVDVTNSRHYAKARCGHPSARSPKAVRSEVNRVKCTKKANPYSSKSCEKSKAMLGTKLKCSK